MDKCALYAGLYMVTLLLLTGYLCEWTIPPEFGGMSYGCAEETGIFTVRDAAKVSVGAAIICAFGLIGLKLVLWKCATNDSDDNMLTGAE